MSEGPIRQWWKSHEPPKVSTTDAERVCYKKMLEPRAYCGRRARRAVDIAAGVTCADCRAALRADQDADGSGS